MIPLSAVLADRHTTGSAVTRRGLADGRTGCSPRVIPPRRASWWRSTPRPWTCYRAWSPEVSERSAGPPS